MAVHKITGCSVVTRSYGTSMLDKKCYYMCRCGPIINYVSIPQKIQKKNFFSRKLYAPLNIASPFPHIIVTYETYYENVAVGGNYKENY